MMFGNRPVVGVWQCKKHDNIDEVKINLNKLLDSIGGLVSLISPGDTVLLKPNLLTNMDYLTGATTNPHLVFAAVQLCQEAGAKKVIVAEGAAIGNNTDKVFQDLGFDTLAKKYHCEIRNFFKDEFITFINPLAKNMKRIKLPKSFVESDVVINLPAMKTHDALDVTLGLKNMKGLVHPNDKKRFHKWGLAQNVVDLGHLVMPELTIMDGTIGLEGMGPVVGDPVHLGLILASTDTIALDRVCLEIMGFQLDEVEYIRLAGEQGLGCTDLDRIEIMGENLAKVKRPFKRLSIDHSELEKRNIRVMACDACSGCNNAVNSYIYSTILKDSLDKFKDCTLVYGQNPVVPDDVAGKVIALGVCCRNIETEDQIYVPGCPPHPHHIDDYTRELDD
jgi:uncharacterized protein (DUF362 family)